MNPRTTLVLAIVALLLGGFVYLYEVEGEAARESAAEDERKIHRGLEATEIDALELLTSDDVAARFERREGRWMLVSPLEAPGDASALDGIAEALVNLVREGEVSAAGDLEQYGLGDEARVVRFEAGGTTRGIRLGGNTPIGGHRYVARLADDEVAYVASYRTNAFERELADLRERRISGFEVGEVDAVELRWPGAEVTLVRKGEGWSVAEPVVDRADETTVRDLLSDLAFLRAAGFVDEPDEEVEAALRAPELEIRLTLAADGAGATELRTSEILIGGLVGEAQLVRSPSGALYTIDPARLEDLPRTLSAYRYKTLADFEVSAARRIELRFAPEDGGTQAVEASLGDAGWTSAAEPAIDSDRAGDLVRALAGLRANEIVADEMGEAELAAFGLAPPSAVVRIGRGSESGEADEWLAEIAIGRLDVDRGLYAQRVGSTAVYLLDADLAEDVPISAEAFAARFERAEEEAGAAEEAGEEIELEPDALDPDPLVGDPVEH